MTNARLKQPEPNASAVTAKKLGVLTSNDVIFRMWHQTQHQTRCVADTGDVGDGAVGVRTRVPNGDLVVGAERFECRVVAHESTFTVSNGTLDLGIEASRPHAQL
jgi:hypothetical protein